MISDPYLQAEIPPPRLRTIPRLWALAAVLAVAGTAALALDLPLATWVRDGSPPRFVQKLCGLAETFGHGLGIVLIAIIIAVLDPRHRYGIPRILAASLGAGLAGNLCKLLVARGRPNYFEFDTVDHGIATFLQWLPLGGNPSLEQSFPSSHTATAAGLAIVLAAFYPRGRWLFPAFAVLAGMQRVLHQSHFASDVFWGAAIGCACAPLCVYGSRLSLTFDRLETFLLKNREPLADASRHAPERSGARSQSAA